MFKRKKNQTEKDQLDLNLKTSKGEKLFKFKFLLSKYESYLSLTPIWKSTLYWIIVTIDTLIVTIGISRYETFYDQLPSSLPIFFSQTEPIYLTGRFSYYTLMSLPLIFDILIILLFIGFNRRFLPLINLVLVTKLVINIMFILFLIQLFTIFLV